LRRLRFDRCQPNGVIMMDADLTPGADLFGIDLTGADLSGIDLTGADLTGAQLLGAIPDVYPIEL